MLQKKKKLQMVLTKFIYKDRCILSTRVPGDGCGTLGLQDGRPILLAGGGVL